LEKEKIILGIDPGTRVLGYGIIGCSSSPPELLSMGILDLRRNKDLQEKLERIYRKVDEWIVQYNITHIAIEAPFYGKNVQSMLKLGQVIGVVMASAFKYNIFITEYYPKKIKQAVTGTGKASKEQMAEILKHLVKFPKEKKTKFLDASDGLAVAYCHFMILQRSFPGSLKSKPKKWEEFIKNNPDKIR
jgi:crossover junction endodeoxyribonuclease RuvC